MINMYCIDIVKGTDYPRLCEFLAEFPEETETPEEWMKRLHYWWDENPACDENHIRGVILRFDSRIVGFSGNIPTKMIWGGKEITVISGTTWRVLPEYRKYSMDMWLKHREITSNYVYFNTTPNERVRKILQVLKFSQYSIAKYWFYYFGAPETLFRNRAVKPILYIFVIVSCLWLKLCRLCDNSLKLYLPSSENDINKMQNLWLNHKGTHLFTNVRDIDYLKWIMQTMTILCVSWKDDLLGYLVLHPNVEKKLLIVVDYWSTDLEYHAYKIVPLLLTKFKNHNIVLPSYCHRFSQAAKCCLMIPRRNQSLGYIHNGHECPLVMENSFLSLLQGDYGL